MCAGTKRVELTPCPVRSFLGVAYRRSPGGCAGYRTRKALIPPDGFARRENHQRPEWKRVLASRRGSQEANGVHTQRPHRDLVSLYPAPEHRGTVLGTSGPACPFALITQSASTRSRDTAQTARGVSGRTSGHLRASGRTECAYTEGSRPAAERSSGVRGSGRQTAFPARAPSATASRKSRGAASSPTRCISMPGSASRRSSASPLWATR